jgi:hypothetical protein
MLLLVVVVKATFLVLNLIEIHIVIKIIAHVVTTYRAAQHQLELLPPQIRKNYSHNLPMMVQLC